MESDNDLVDAAAKTERQVPGVGLLTALVQATFFMQLFQYCADARFLHPTPQERAEALIERHPRFYRACRNADYAARAVLLLVLTGVVALAAIGAVLKLFYFP